MLSLIVLLVIVGVVLWMINTLIPMDGRIRSVVNVVVLICVLFYVLQAFGILDAGHGFGLGLHEYRR